MKNHIKFVDASAINFSCSRVRKLVDDEFSGIERRVKPSGNEKRDVRKEAKREVK